MGLLIGIDYIRIAHDILNNNLWYLKKSFKKGLNKDLAQVIYLLNRKNWTLGLTLGFLIIQYDQNVSHSETNRSNNFINFIQVFYPYICV